MKSKVLLISFQEYIDTIGLKYLNSYLINKSIESSILYLPKYKSNNILSIKKFIGLYKPKIIGISLMSIEFYKAKEFSQKIKQLFPKIKMVWGGIHPSIDSKECLKYADHIFIGDSEETFYNFINNNLKDKIIRGKRVCDLNKLPFTRHFADGNYILHKNKIQR